MAFYFYFLFLVNDIMTTKIIIPHTYQGIELILKKGKNPIANNAIPINIKKYLEVNNPIKIVPIAAIITGATILIISICKILQ